MNDNTRLHYRYNLCYITSILLLAIVALLTVKWGSIPELVSLFSFGLTLTSLFLALIAIIYSMVSNISFSQHVGALQNAAASVSDSTEALAETTADLKAKVAELPGVIQRVGDRIEKSQRELMQQVAGSAQQGQQPATPQAKPTLPLVASFVKTASLSGTAILYACQIAATKKLPMNLEDLTAKTGLVKFLYAQGFLVACSACGLLDYNEKDWMLNVVSLHESLPDLRKVCEEKKQQLFPGDDKKQSRERVDAALGAVDAYFV
jgi:ABC-type multidrug transport system fused ATPase/permease subunit